MIRKLNTRVCTAAFVALACTTGSAFAGFRATTDFVDPAHWSAGDANTTYQEWDVFATVAASAPDVGVTVNPTITTAPTSRAIAPGFIASSGNYYAFSGPYGFEADIYNHGGASGVGGLPAGSGTHVIVQIAASMNPDPSQGGPASIATNSLQIVDLAGNPIAGGDNASALAHVIFFEGVVSSSFGDVSLREEAWEFFLPGYVGDFRVEGDVLVHASFDRLRVDSAIASQAFSLSIPEPASLGMLVLGGLLIGRRKR